MSPIPRHNARSARGPGGAVAAAHPLAVEAGLRVLDAGGSAVDAAVAAQAVVCVVMPQAAGLGGDMLALVRDGAVVHAVNGTGCSPAALTTNPPSSGGGSVTVPGLIDAWLVAHRTWGRLELIEVLTAAIGHAERGIDVEGPLVAAVHAQRGRLLHGGADRWSLLRPATRPGSTWRQPELAELLSAVAESGRAAFYAGPAAAAIAAAVRRHGGCLSMDDLADHRTLTPEPLTVPWGSGIVHVQPPASQGVLLAMSLRRIAELVTEGVDLCDHILVETTEAAFQHRSECARGRRLMGVDLPIDLERAAGRGGPRAYLHTAGVATVDRDGQVVSSLVSVFDDFGSGVYVSELGIVINNRAAGFTDADNAAGPGKRPIHTLAPAMVTSGPLVDGPGDVFALATPGADGQVQTLLQVLAATGRTLKEAVSLPRWRSEGGDLLVEEDHPGIEDLRSRGHQVRLRPPGGEEFGAVVAAGTAGRNRFAVADWRRQTAAGAA